MKLVKYTALVCLCLAIAATAVIAQETETKVVDEVVAQVNDGVITLSGIKREMRGVVDSKIAEGMKRADAEKQVDEKRGELIANLINEELLIQKAKELGLGTDIEADLNSRFVQIMKQYNLKTLDALYQEMNKQGVNPQEIKEVWRKQATRDRVLQREVQSKLYWKFSGKDLKDYYDKHKDKFTKPETIGLSEIFLGFAGRDEATVRGKAKQIVAQLRTGADFVKLVTENSDRPNVAQTKGKVDSMPLKELDDKYAAAVKGLKVGGISDPVEVGDLGVSILRVDERSDASNESQFDESTVRLEMMKEQLPDAQKSFISQLHDESYIKISETYRPLVSPILFADERKAKPAN